MKEFTERFKSKTDAELLNIIENSENYRPLAVEAAKAEIESRNLSDDEISDIEGKEQRSILSKATGATKQTSMSEGSANRIIKSIAILFTLIWLYYTHSQSLIIQYVFSRDEVNWDLHLIQILIPILYPPVMVFLFWKKQKAGWVLQAICLTYICFSIVYLIFTSFLRLPYGFRMPDAAYVLPIILWLAILRTICLKGIRNVFGIDRRIMYLTIGVTILGSLLLS